MKDNLIVRRIAFCTLLMVILYTAACSSNTQKTSFSVGALNGPTGLSLAKMMHENSVQDTASQANYIIKNDPELIKAMMAREEVELALIPFTMAALLYNNDFPYQLVGVPVWGSLFLVGRDTLTMHPADLKSKTIHVLPRYTTPDIVFRHLLIKHDIDPEKDLRLDYTFPTPIELSGALMAGRAASGIIPEPMVSRVLHQNTELSVMLDLAGLWQELYGEEIPLAQTALVVHRAWAKEHKSLLEHWCRQYESSIQWTNENPSEAGTLAVMHQIGKNPEEVASAVPRCRLDFKYAYEQKEKLVNYLTLLNNSNHKIIGGRIPDEAFFYQK